MKLTELKDKDALSTARNDLAAAFRVKAKKVSEKYIMPPKTTDFAIVYAPTEGLYAELASYRDPKTKELINGRIKNKIQNYYFWTKYLMCNFTSFSFRISNFKVQKHATQIHDDLKNITIRFIKHFDQIKTLEKN